MLYLETPSALRGVCIALFTATRESVSWYWKEEEIKDDLWLYCIGVKVFLESKYDCLKNVLLQQS